MAIPKSDWWKLEKRAKTWSLKKISKLIRELSGEIRHAGFTFGERTVTELMQTAWRAGYEAGHKDFHRPYDRRKYERR